jgi:hypothetical protein
MLKKENIKYTIACIIMLLLAFLQCYKAVHDLHWAYEPDFDRDIGYIRNILDGHFGQDPNIDGQYLWYNPLMYMTETGLVKLTGLPINIVVARAGMFLNLLSPIAFFIMLVKLFDYKIALAGLLSFVFLANGNLPGWGGATYSPWLLADCFVQFIFYINLYLCYKAYQKQQLIWFAVLGTGIGIGFLGHAAPTIIMILILVLLQGQKMIQAIKERDFAGLGTYFLQGVATLVPFLVFSFPFLYYIVGKYQMHFINRVILECAPGIFARKATLELIKVNLSISLIIAIVGFVWFYKNYQEKLIRKIILNWLYITLVLYAYSSVVPTADKMLHINLPDTIPAVHYFFYFKAVQSVFFGFGLIFLFKWAVDAASKLNKAKKEQPYLKHPDNLLIAFILLCTVAYYPIYSKRQDFTEPRQQALNKEKRKDDLDIYYFISKNLPLEQVILCPYGQSLFPVMATGMKMVSIEVYFSNPYISFDEREKDRETMLAYLSDPSREPAATAEKLFAQYKVSYILLTNPEYETYKNPPFASSKIVFKNNKYTLLSLSGYKHG